MTATPSTRPQMGDELLPCPFCGAPADPPELYGESKTAMFVDCSKCGANVYHGTADKEANRAAVVAAWNRRASLPQPPAGGTGEELQQQRRLIVLATVLLSECRERFIHKHATYGDPAKNPWCQGTDKWNCVECGVWGKDGGQHKPDCIVARIDAALWEGKDISTPAQSGLVEALNAIMKVFAADESDGSVSSTTAYVMKTIALAALSRAPSQPAPVVADAAVNPNLLAALQSAIKIANEAAEEWDKAPNGMKAGKILLALAGLRRGYRADIDAIHLTLLDAASPQPDRESEPWETIEAERVYYVSEGKERILCDRLPSPVTIVVKRLTSSNRPQATEGE